MEAERTKYEHIKLKLTFDNIKQSEKEVNDVDIAEFKKKIDEQSSNNNNGKYKNKKLEANFNELVEGIRREEMLLKDTISTSAKVDESMIPRVQLMITSCNKIKTELNNIKRNTENLPKIMKTDKQKRDYIKSEKGNATNHLNNVKDLHRKEIREINKARELNDKKNLITDIAVKQRFTLQKEYNDLKIRTSQLKSEHDETKKIIDSKNKSR